MPAELGQTTDPKALVPGDPECIAADLRTAVGTMGSLDRTGTGLAAVDPGPWTGQASDLFHTSFGAEPPKWSAAAQQLGAGGNALAGYCETLQWGQGQAQIAIEKYTAARAASRAAAAQYNATAAQHGGAAMGPFQDPGAAGMAEAKRILREARQKVAESGDEAAGELDATDTNGNLLEKGFGTEGDGPSRYGSKHEATRGYGSGDGEGYLGDGVTIGGKHWTLFDKHGGTDLAHGSTEGHFGSGAAGGSGHADWSGDGADYHVNSTVGLGGLGFSAGAEAYSAKGEATGELHAGPAKAEGTVSGSAGSEADVAANAGPFGGTAEGGAFIGDQASVGGGVSVAGIGPHAEAGLSDGVGGHFSVQAGMGQDGKFHLGGSLSATLGIGGKLGGGVTVDPGAVVHTIGGAANWVGDNAGGVKDFGDSAVDTAGDGLKDAGDGLKDAGDAVYDNTLGNIL